MTRTGKSPKLSQSRPEPFVEIHSRDALGAGLANGSIARIRSRSGAMQARVVWSDEMRRGEVFVPMHWTDGFASEGRVGPLIAASVDPHSGQPELKHTPVALEPVALAWYGFALCREPLQIETATYQVRARGAGYWRHELAGMEPASDWAAWARRRFGADGEWVELSDDKAGSYRGARLVDGRLQSCVFISAKTRLPDRHWLGQLFALPSLDDPERAGLLAGKPTDGTALAGPIVCACFAVGRDALVEAIASQKAASRQDIGRLLRAGTNCGSCIPEINDLLVRHRPESFAETAAVESEVAAS
jgi:assimilatory nitrate reductase catalytic subunit